MRRISGMARFWSVVLTIVMVCGLFLPALPAAASVEEETIEEGEDSLGESTEEEEAEETAGEEEENPGTTIGQRMTEDSEEVPEGSELVWILEQYGDSGWEPACDVLYQIFDEAGEACEETLSTDEEGKIVLYKTANGYPSVRFPEVTVSLNTVEGEEGTYRLLEDEEATDEKWGQLVGYSAEADGSSYSMEETNAVTLVNSASSSDTAGEEFEEQSAAGEEETRQSGSAEEETGESAEAGSTETPEGETESEEDTESEESPEEEKEDGIALFSVEAEQDPDVLYLSDVDTAYQSIGWGSFKKDLSPSDTTITLRVNGSVTSFAKGIGAHAESTLIYDVRPMIEAGYDFFQTYYGVNSTATSGNVKFFMYTTTDESYSSAEWIEVEGVDSSAKSGGSNAGFIEIPLTEGMTYLKLYADPNGGNGSDHAVYADAKFIHSASYYDDLILRVEDYDEDLKNYYEKYGTDVTSDDAYESLLLKRDLVDKVGYYEFQNLIKEEDDGFREMLLWLFDNTDFLKLYLTGGSVGPNYRTGGYSYSACANDPYTSSLDVLYQLWKKYSDDFWNHADNDLRPKMIISLSLTLTGNVKFWFGTGGSGTVDSSIIYPDPVERYEIYGELYEDGLLTDYFDELQVPEMRYIMASPIHNDELRWASEMAKRENYKTNCYSWMNYVSGYSYHRDAYYNDETWGENPSNNYVEKYYLNEYNITNYGYGVTTSVKYPMNWMCMADGGTCWPIANFCQNIWSSYGRPCYICGAMGGTHEVYMAYNRETGSDGSTYGRWTIENGCGADWNSTHYGAYDSTGWHIARMIGDWGMGTDFDFNNSSFIILGQAAINDFDHYVLAEELEMLSRVYEDDEETREEIYWAMLDVQSIHFDAWYGLVKLYAASETKTDAQKAELADRIMEKDALYYYPLPLYNILTVLMNSVDSTVYRTMIQNEEKAALQAAKQTTDQEFYSAYAVRVVSNWLLGSTDADVASFSFDGENAGKIILDETKFPHAEYWEYSLDGGETWSAIIHDAQVEDAEILEDAGEEEIGGDPGDISDEEQVVVKNPNVVSLTQEEIGQVNPEDDILIRFIQVPGYWYTVEIEESPAPTAGSIYDVTGLYPNPWENRVIYAEDVMEWRDAGTEDAWTKFADRHPDREENPTFEVRYGAHENYTAGESITLSYNLSGYPDNYGEREGYSYIPLSRISLFDSTDQANTTRAKKYALDGSIYSFYQTPSNTTFPHYLVLAVNRPTYLSRLEYQCNLGNTAGGQIAKTKIYVSMTGADGDWTEVDYQEGTDGLLDYTEETGLVWTTGNNETGKNSKNVVFTPVKAQYIKIEVWADGGTSKMTSVAGIRLFEDEQSLLDKTELETEVEEIEALALQEENYLSSTWNALQRALRAAETILNDPDATEGEVEEALSALQSARSGLKEAQSITGTITWNDSGNQDGIRPKSVTAEVRANDSVPVSSVDVFDDGTDTWTYVVKDLQESEGVQYTISVADVEGYSVKSEDGIHFTLSHTPEKVSVTVQIDWDDADDAAGARPTTIRCHLLADGVKADSANLTYANCAWYYTGFAARPKYRDGGTEILYTVVLDSETNPATGYVSTYSGEGTDFVITNTYAPDQTALSVIKAWDDANDQDGIRPESVQIELLDGGNPTGTTLSLRAENQWRGVFAGLPLSGDYSVQEAETEGYEADIEVSASYGTVITNTHEPEKIDLSGSVTWNDDGDAANLRPVRVTLRLLADGEEVAEQTVKGEAYTFSDFPKYRNGEEILYTVTQDAAVNYTTEYQGMNVINTYAPGEESVSVTKHWEDNDDQDGMRPESVVAEMVNRETGEVEEIVLARENNWTATFTYHSADAYFYTVREREVDGYTGVTLGNMSTGLILFNRHEPETVTVSGSKTWSDDEDAAGIRPDSLTVHLWANGEEADARTVTAGDGWSWSWTVDRFQDGTEIAYSITEDAVSNYSAYYHGYDVNNVWTEGKTSLTVSAAWEDEGDQDGIRPESVRVTLLSEGEKTEQTLSLRAGENWTGSFTELDEVREEEKIAYTVESGEVPGYTVSVSGDAVTGYQITYLHTPETTEVVGSKIWDDDDNAAGERPDSITVNLYADGVLTRQHRITVEAPGEDEGWYWEFLNLPRYESGREIVYTLTEEVLEGYTSAVEGSQITNTYEKGKISIPVSVSWEGEDDGTRPASVVLTLMRDGTKVASLTLTAADGWTGIFSAVEARSGSSEIDYSLAVSADGYEAEILKSSDGSFTVFLTRKSESGKSESGKAESGKSESGKAESSGKGDVKSAEVQGKSESAASDGSGESRDAAQTEKQIVTGKEKGEESSASGGEEEIALETPTLKSVKASTVTAQKITWKSVKGAEGYRVYRKRKDGTWKRLGETEKTSFTSKNLTPGTSYTYTVRAYCTKEGTKILSGYDAKGISAVCVPPAPTLKSAVSDLKGTITVSWGKVKGADGYRLYRRTPGGKWKRVTDIVGLRYRDTKRTVGSTYLYTVKAFVKTKSGKKVLSSCDREGLTCENRPETPKRKKAVSDENGAITVSWGKVSGADGYRLYRKCEGGKWKKVCTQKGRSYTDTGLTDGKAYTYTVKAYVKTGGKTIWSRLDASGITCLSTLTRPAVPKLKSALCDGSGAVTVSWGKVKGADGYRLYRWTKGDHKWRRVKTLKATHYIDRSLKAGTAVTYTVRAYRNVDGVKVFGSYKKAGISCLVTDGEE